MVLSTLTRRERQIMDILYKRGRATASEVLEDLSGNPHSSTVRTQLRMLEEKGHVSHEEEGLRFIYFPAAPLESQPCATLLTLSSMARPSRLWLRSSAARGHVSQTRNWIGLLNS